MTKGIDLMKSTKTLSFILATLIIFSVVLSVPAQALSDNVFGDFRYFVNSDNTVTIEEYTGNSAELTLPEKIDGKSVKVIGDNAFYGNLGINKIVIPEGVTVLGESAFANCSELREVVLPETVNKIDDAAFFSCTKLYEISLPDNISFIGDGAFYFCESLENVEFPENLASTGEYVFGYCRGLETVTVNEKLTTISPQTFIGCRELKTVKLHNNIKTIGRKAFMNCISLTNMVLPESLDAVHDNAFDSCYDLVINRFDGSYIGKYAFSSCQIRSIKFSENLSYIGYDAFLNCNIDTMYIPSADFEMESGAFAYASIKSFATSPDNVYFTVKDDVLYSKDMTVLVSYPSYKEEDTFILPYSVKTISDYAFSNCWMLNKIVLNNTLEKIGNYAFSNVTEVDSFVLPETVKEIGDGAFCGCASLRSIKIPDGIKKISSNTFESCSFLQQVEIPDSVEIIEDNAFNYCTELTSFEITKGIRKVTALAFTGCCNLKTFKVNSENSCYTVDNNCIVSKDKSTIVAYPNGLKKTVYRVSDEVTSIEAYAFVNNETLREIYVSENVKAVGKYAFGVYMGIANRKPDRIEGFTVYVGDKGAVYDFAVESDLAVFKAIPIQNETDIELNVGEQFDYQIEDAFDETVFYSVSDRKIADVDADGCVTAINKGKTTVVATVGTRNFVLNLEVDGTGTNIDNNEYGYDLSDYRTLTKDTHEQWEKDYNEFNSHISMDSTSSPNITCYSGPEYIPIVATQTGDFSRTEESYGEDIGQYYHISDGLSLELGRHKLNENLVLFSGTNNVSYFTGASSSLKDMKNAIGKTITDKAVISTSIDHGVAANFGTGSYHTVLEIYAPAKLTKGAFIKSFSQYPYEQEILLDCNQSYKILDAGVRTKTVTDFSGNTEELTERFIKLIVVDEESPEIEYQKGDVNLDGKIDVNDVTLLQMYIAKIESFTDEQSELADFNGDLTVNVSDVTAIQFWIAENSCKSLE